jgi:hypothetical protein
MREIQENTGLVAFCGLYCGACGAFLKEKCNGCSKNEKAAWCKIRICCKDKNIITCAECDEYTNPKDCKKFNNMMSKIFAMLFKSDRAACIAQIKKIGTSGHAKRMTELRKHSLTKNLV